MEWFTTNAQTISSDVGLAGNNIAAFYPFMAFIVCGAYFMTNRRTIIGDYFQGEEEYEKSHDVKVIAQLGLRFFTSTSTITGVYNESTPDEKARRERQFVQFIRAARQHTEQGTSGMNMTIEVVSGSSRSASDELPKQDKTVHNTDCNQTFTQSSWWKAKYEFNNLCNTERPIVHRYLPISYYLEGTDANGARVQLYGAVESLSIESDRDVASVIPVDSVAWKMTMELVDFNWRQKGGEPGVNKVFRFVCSQQNDKCIFSTLVGADGKPFNVFVSQFKLRLGKKPVDVTSSDVLSEFLTNDEDSIAELNIHPSRDLLLSYMVRALPLIDSTITYTKDSSKNMLLLGGATTTTQLPLEVHIRSPEPLNDTNDKFVAYPVLRIMLRYVTKPPTPGNMEPDGSAIRSVQFLLPGNRILAQDINDKKKWVVNDTVLHRDSTVDLIMLNKTPVPGGKNRTPGINDARGSQEDGVVLFTSFPGVRQGFSDISVNKVWQDRIRGTVSPAQSWNDLRVNAKADTPTLGEIFGDRRGNALVLGGVVALLAGWKLGSRNTVSSVGFLSSGIGFSLVIFVFVCALAEYLDKLPENLRPYEPILYVMTCMVLLIAIATVLYASRFVPETPPGFYLSVLIAMCAAVFVISMETRSPNPMAPSAKAFKISILLVLAVSVYILSNEIRKLYQKAEVGFARVPLKANIGDLPNMAALLTVVVVLLSMGAICYIMVPSPPDECDRLMFEKKRNEDAVHKFHLRRDSREIKAHAYFVNEGREIDSELNACISSQRFPFPRLNIFYQDYLRNIVPFLIVAFPLYMNLVMPVVGNYIGNRWPSRLSQEKTNRNQPPLAKRRVEDGRIPRGVWVISTLIGLALLISIAKLLLPHASVDPGQCTFLREREMENREITRNNPLVYDSKKRMSLVRQGEWRYDCVPRDRMATTLVFGGLGIVLALSFITPARKRFVPTTASAMGALMNLLYFVFVSGIVIWAYSEQNRIKIMNL